MQGRNTLLYRKVYIMSKIAQIRELVSRFNLDSQIQSGMPGYVISLYTKSGSRSFSGNTSEVLAYLRGYGDALYVTNPTTPFYDENDLPVGG
jgi:hypothetical protein